MSCTYSASIDLESYVFVVPTQNASSSKEASLGRKLLFDTG